jgi:hypothetical protein
VAFDITQYVPDGVTIAFATVIGWIFRDHVYRDDARFKEVVASFRDVSTKLDQAVKVQAENHAEILKILLEQHT